MATTNSILLYGAEIWAEAMQKGNYMERPEKVQRLGALRVACAYRTVSKEAILVIAGATPISLLATERQRIYERKKEVPSQEAIDEAKQRTREDWTERWRNTGKAGWTRRLITDLAGWVDRKHGEVNYYITQFLSGHGNFQSYLHKMRKVRSPECVLCPSEKDDAHHTFFHCVAWSQERRRLEEEIGQFNPDNVVGLMLENPEKWLKVGKFIEGVLRQKANRVLVRVGA